MYIFYDIFKLWYILTESRCYHVEKTFAILLITLAVIVTLFLIADVYMIITGSLEMIPTPEQTDKARISYAIIFIILAALEFCLIKRVLKLIV